MSINSEWQGFDTWKIQQKWSKCIFLIKKCHQWIFEVFDVNGIARGLDVDKAHVVGPAAEHEGAVLQAPRPGFVVDGAECSLSDWWHEDYVPSGRQDSLLKLKMIFHEN